MGSALSKESKESRPHPYNPKTPSPNGWQLSRLCKACRNITWDSLINIHHEPYNLESNTRGRWHTCHLCTLIWTGLGEPDVPYDASARPGEIYRMSNERDGFRYFKYRILLFPAKNRQKGLNETPYEQTPLCMWSGIHPDVELFNGINHSGFGQIALVLSSIKQLETPLPWHHQIEKSTDSSTSIDIAKNWLNTCRLSHSKSCTPSAKRLPTRLLDLGELQVCEMDVDSITAQPVLVLTDRNPSIPPTTEYITLSHCWGDPKVASKFTKLSSANLKAFLKEIPTSALSKTFQDTITIARRFGFRYLWIDSLCIIQDSKEDWLQESARMGDIYASSSLNIAASGATDGNGGLFFKRNPIAVKRCISITNKGSLCSLSRGTCYKECVTSLPLNSRAWVFQETYLSPRSLHFGSSQLAWQCCQNTACETFPDALPGFEYAGTTKLHVTDLHLNSHLPRQWNDVIRSYSQCQLTQGTDKLIALSGVARKFHTHFGIKYLAGLWEQSILSQLAWSVESGHTQRPVVYRAPSWSWASVDGSIRPRLYDPDSDSADERLLIRLINAEVTPASPLTDHQGFGIIEKAFLRLECGPLVKIDLEKMNVNTTKPFYKMNIHGQTVRSAEMVLDYHLPDSPPSPSNPPPYYCFLPTSRSLGVRVRTGSRPGIEGLILEAVPTSGKGHFRRLGFGQIQDWTPEGTHWNPFIVPNDGGHGGSKADGGFLDLDDYLTRHSSGPDDLMLPLIEVAQKTKESVVEEGVYERVVRGEEVEGRYEIVLI